MRHHEIGVVHRPPFDPQEVEIDGARAPALATNTSEIALDREHRLEQLARLDPRRKLYCRIQIVGLRRPDGRGLVDLRMRHDVRKLPHGRAQHADPIPDIASKPDNGDHGPGIAVAYPRGYGR